MELHNTVEDIVIARVNEIFETIGKEGNTDKYCICQQCRMDIACYALNRMKPQYIVSNRGAPRVQWVSIERQQQIADITTLVHEGFKQVKHNQRPFFPHSAEDDKSNEKRVQPAYNVPTIMGRIFNGENFAPLSDVDVELLWNGNLVPMKDGNWQNPYRIVSNTEGNYSFWPAADIASGPNKHKIFDYSLKVTASGFDILYHHFTIPVASEIQTAGSFTLNRTFKLPDLYLFRPGENEQGRSLCMDDEN
jgi:competence protein ComFB